MRENADQYNSKYGHFLRGVYFKKLKYFFPLHIRMNDSSEHTDRNYLKNIQGKKIKAKNAFPNLKKIEK